MVIYIPPLSALKLYTSHFPAFQRFQNRLPTISGENYSPLGSLVHTDATQTPRRMSMAYIHMTSSYQFHQCRPLQDRSRYTTSILIPPYSICKKGVPLKQLFPDNCYFGGQTCGRYLFLKIVYPEQGDNATRTQLKSNKIQ